jgi:hypothetical protein
MPRILLIHVLTLAGAGLIGGMGMADGGAFAPLNAMVLYLPAVCTWLAVDIFREFRTKRRLQAD